MMSVTPRRLQHRSGAVLVAMGVGPPGDVSIATSHNRVVETGQTSTFTQQVVVAAVHASLTHPTAGQTNVNTANLCTWTDIPAGYGYQLWIGTKPGDGSGSRPASTACARDPWR
jgi:hypothetical protein